MSFLPLRNHDLQGTCEIVDGMAVLCIRYSQALMSRSDSHELIDRLLKKLYDNAVKTSEPSIVSCAVVVQGNAESEDLGLIRAVMSLWDTVTKLGGRLVLIEYPIATVSGRATELPPMMPDFGLARDLTSGLKWVCRPKAEFEGGHAWNADHGVSRGRSLLPGERFLGEWDIDEH